MKLEQKIVQIYSNSRRTYGSPRIHRKLVREGYSIGKKRVERIMQELDICAVAKKKYRATTDSNHSQPVAENHLNRKFTPDKPNQAWVADITYIYTQERRLALPGYHHGPVFPENHRLVPEKQINQRISHGSITHGHETEKTLF